MTDSTRHDEPSTRELIAQFSEQTSRLVRDEMRLAVAEVKEKGKHAGVGVGMFSGAGLLSFFGAAALIAAAILALELVLPAWAAALIVAGALFVLAALAALMGRREVGKAKPPPERTVENIKRDVDEMTGRRDHDR
ncbi:phage holin family protein [Phytoactinopolyspora halotolerans]|uniref:Phage holin family protein n=1 Tax=Phytoactinopolyspora halotolerans TaxID=1981512 RepID=A0A6L9S041_9ACTN|nr:phage holin family protein [Phytoactinopolyspora halotolerans]NED98754.1 phage holin family protein [Phytoactinopolyspora halotolerans]